MSTNRLPYLKGRRTILRKSIPAKLAYAESLLALDPTDENLIISINTAMRELKENIERLESLTGEIIDLMIEPTEEEIEAEATKIEADASELTKILHGLNEKREWIQKLEHAPNSPAADATLEAQVIQLRQEMEQLRTNPVTPGDHQLPNGASVRLPKLEVEKFDGDILRFKEFWDHFEVAIGNNPRLRPVEKLNYLRAYLSGEARRVIAGLTATDENYDVAVTLLCERYGDPQASIDAHYSRLMDLQSVPNQTTRIRALLDNIESHLRCLQALGEDIEHRHFISLISAKLPRDLVAHLEEMKGSKTVWSVALLRSSLHNVLNAREIAERQNGHGEQRMDNRHIFTPRKDTSFRPKTRSTIETLMVNDKNAQSRPKTPCIYCNRTNHFHSDCRTVNSLTKRREKVRQLRRCFICLKEGHASRTCTNTKPCFYCHESRSHHQSLCPKQFSSLKPTKESAAVAADLPTTKPTGMESSRTSAPSRSSQSNDTALAVGEKVILQTALVKLYNPDKSNYVITRALLDSGSNRTYVTTAISKALNLQAEGEEFFSIGTFGSEKRKAIKTSNATMLMQMMDGSRKMLNVNVVDNITGTITRVPIAINLAKYLTDTSSETSLPLADPMPLENEKSDIGLLIGNDYYLDLINPDRIEINPGLYLLSSRLGWLVTGRIEESSCVRDDLAMFIDSRMNTVASLQLESPFSGLTPDKSLPIPINMQDLWSLDTIGIKDSPEIVDDDKAMDSFNRTVKVADDGRYQVTWPWKDEIPDLPTNYQLSLGRFRTIAKKFQSNKDLFAKYRDIIREQENLEIIEKVNDEKAESAIKQYIPHHPVVTPGKETTKVRIVYDASAKVRKTAPSLNDCLYRGPIMLEDLCGLLLRFRLNQFGVTADIEKAFLQVSLQESARDVTRFFWFKNDLSPTVDGNVQEYRFWRVPFGVISSPFLLAATIRFHLSTLSHKKPTTETAEQIKDGLYVDNVITSFNSEEQVFKFYEEAKAIFRSAAMNLRQWMSNNERLRQRIPKHDQIESSVVKVLGITWNVSEDTLTVGSKSCPELNQASTKRQLLQRLASFFDPLGLFSPITLKAKLLLREVCQDKYERDATLSPSIKEKWKSIAKDLSEAASKPIPRCVTAATTNQSQETVYELLCFCDASASAFAAAVYLKSRCAAYSHVNLVFSKTRLSPNERTTIPRMELMALLIGVRGINFVQQQLKLPVESKTVWTDSTCVLHWLNSDNRKSIFVENRLKEIRKSSNIIYRYVTTTDNPADVATRGNKTVSQLAESDWWCGPRWLRSPQAQWPVWKEEVSPTIADREEKRTKGCKRFYEAGHTETGLDVSDTHEPAIISTAEEKAQATNAPFDIQPERFSSLLRLYRITAWATRFLARIRKHPSPDESLTASEISAAKLRWDKHIQAKHFAEIYEAIAMKRSCNIKDQLNIQVDETGLLRCYGRFQHSNMPDNKRFPKLLPKTCHYTNLVITSSHQRHLHAGVSFTLAQLRQEYWIPQGRSVVQAVLKTCRICRKFQGGPYAAPIMPPYPPARINKSAPFSYTGLDYLGPLLVKTATASEAKKVWICLYTCMVVRAIHLELVEDMTAEQFLMSLRRFIARRGKPILIISDNASQFKLAKNTLDRLYGKILSSDAVKSYTSSSQIAWKYITERAPWMGGFYERLVGSVKNALKKSIGKLLLSTAQLQTCLAEIEAVVNRRPLMPVTDSFDDAAILTPSHFLTLNPTIIDSASTNVHPTDPHISSTATELLLAWKKGNSHLNRFWQVWHSDYLNALRQRSDTKHTEPKVKQRTLPSVDDVVLVKDDCTTRGKWTIARIMDLYTGDDGHVRSVKLKVPGGRFIQRPIRLLYPLEMRLQQPDRTPASVADNGAACGTPSATVDIPPIIPKSQTSYSSGSSNQDNALSRRTQRRAKLQAKEALKLLKL